MTGALTLADMVNPIQFSKGDVALHGFEDGTLGVLNKTGTAFRPLEAGTIAGAYFRPSTVYDTPFLAWTDSIYDTVIMFRAGANYCAELVRAGDINMLNDKFIKVGKDSDGVLPIPELSDIGKLIYVGSAPTKLYMAILNESSVPVWKQIQFVP